MNLEYYPAGQPSGPDQPGFWRWSLRERSSWYDQRRWADGRKIQHMPITATSDIDMADSSDDMEVVGNDDLDDIGPTLVNEAVRMKVLEDVS